MLTVIIVVGVGLALLVLAALAWWGHVASPGADEPPASYWTDGDVASSPTSFPTMLP